MRHRVKKGRKLGRDLDHRKQLLRNLLTSLIEKQKLETTLAKAKEVKREFDLLVNLAKRSVRRNNFSSQRKIFSFLTTKPAAQKLFDSILPKLQDRSSGYLTLQRTGRLRNDASEVAVLEFVTKIESQPATSAVKAKVRVDTATKLRSVGQPKAK